MAGTVSITTDCEAGQSAVVVGSVTVDSDGGATDTNVPLGFIPSAVFVHKDAAAGAASDYFIFWPGTASGYAAITEGPDTSWTIAQGIVSYAGDGSNSPGFTIKASLHANDDVFRFIAFR